MEPDLSQIRVWRNPLEEEETVKYIPGKKLPWKKLILISMWKDILKQGRTHHSVVEPQQTLQLEHFLECFLVRALEWQEQT